MFRKKYVFILLLALALLGLADSVYLTYEHFANSLPPCHSGFFVDCGKVLKSKWSEIFGIPVALVGVIQYFIESVLILLIIRIGKTVYKRLLLLFSLVGIAGSAYFMFLQFIVIQSICVYCTFSAVVSLLIFYFSWNLFEWERKFISISATSFMYRKFLKRILFKINPEKVHESMVSFGETLSKLEPAKRLFDWLYYTDNDTLTQNVAGIRFDNPIGLSAGFDYDAKLTQILPSLSFGFMTVGTVTNIAYEGNPSPRLGRLPRSKSLMVNKGFKSMGTTEIINKMKKLSFEIPVGISIGRTNSDKLKTQKQSVGDIVNSFMKFEKAKVNNSYYELNISCPNLIHAGSIDFYEPRKLEELLAAIDKLNIKKPVFVKMPIDRSDAEVKSMLKIISMHCPAGVIFGNLQKDRNHPSLIPEEVKKFKVGNFSGKPTWQRSNDLISLTYQNYNKRFIIVGSGGVFSAEDAYEKIKRGASLVQLITGMIFEGPQLISQINLELIRLLKQDGFGNVSDAVGSYNN